MLQERAALEQEPWLVLLIHGQLERCCHHGRGYKPTEPTAVGADLSLGLSDPSVEHTREFGTFSLGRNPSSALARLTGSCSCIAVLQKLRESVLVGN